MRITYFYPFQSGFQRQRSTETAPLKVCNDLLMASDAGINRLKALAGVYGSARERKPEWFSSYLSDRTFFVRTDKFSSNISFLTCGVPQGSVLSPLLFSFYMLSLAYLVF